MDEAYRTKRPGEKSIRDEMTGYEMVFGATDQITLTDQLTVFFFFFLQLQL